MRDSFRKKTNEALEKEKQRVLLQMETTEPGTEDYHKLMKMLQKLDKIGTGNRPFPFKWDTVLIVGAGILSTAMLMIYEERKVISNTKSWNERIRPELPKN